MKTNIKSVILFVLVFMVVCPNSNFAQNSSSSKLVPKWVRSTPYSSNPKMQFIVVEDISPSLTMIEDKRYINLENYLDKEVQTSGSINVNTSNDHHRIHLDFITSIKGGNYRSAQIDQYWKMLPNELFQHYYLYSLSTMDYIRTESISTTTSYGIHGLWRSMIVPGWGQFHKGSKVKGGVMLGSIAALSVGAVFANDQVKTYNTMIQKTYNVDSIRTYANNASSYSSVRNVCIGAAAAVYLYNVVDAIVAPGARRVVVKRNNSFAQNTSFSPTITSNGSIGMSANFEF